MDLSFTNIITVLAIVSLHCVYATPLSANEQISTSTDNTKKINSEAPFGTDCPECYRTDNRSITDEDLRAIRIEYVKQKILRKLNLQYPPVISESDLFNVSASPIFGHLRGVQGDQPPEEEAEEMHEETIILSGQSSDKCVKNIHRKPSVCVYFELDSIKKQLNELELKSVNLWLWRKPDVNDSPNRKQTYVVRELENKGVLLAADRIASLATPTSAGRTEEIMKMEISKAAVKKWMKRKHAKIGIEISCKTCGNSEGQTPVKTGKDEISFTFEVVKRKHRSRQKREATCRHGQTTCCAEELTINFRELGNGFWRFIVVPDIYRTKFCKGDCDSMSLPEYAHTQILRSADVEASRTSICCSPIRFAPMSVLYRNDSSALIYRTIEDITVVECACEY